MGREFGVIGGGGVKGEISNNDPLNCLISPEYPAWPLVQREEPSEEEAFLDSLFTGEGDLARYLLGDNDTTIDTTIDATIDSTIGNSIDPAVVGTYLVSQNAVPCPISGISYTLELVEPGPPYSSSSTSPAPSTTTTSPLPPPPLTPGSPSSTGGARRTGSKRKLREPDSSYSSDSSDSSPSPSKMSKATSWRKEQDKEIAKNDQLLEDYKADVKTTEMFILSHQALLAGHRGETTFDFARKMASFEEQKSDIEAARLKLGSVGKSQKKAQYLEAQGELLKSFKAYIKILNVEKLGVNMEISMNLNNFA